MLTYENAGVDIKAGDRFVRRIKKHVQSTQGKRVKHVQGGYASLFQIAPNKYSAASTDGVGTKLKLAFELKKYDTVGIDLVAMCVNDLLCVGSKPDYFLDYFATGKLDSEIAEKVVSGIARGCRAANTALVGGETAEMPGFYQKGEFDLAGFAVGTVEKSKLLPRKNIRPGDRLIGLASSGFHSNGYSLLRQLVPKSGAARKKWLKLLLEPTKIYVNAMSSIIDKNLIKGASHITGSGFLNIPRMSEKVSYQIKMPRASVLPEVFDWEERTSGLSPEERFRTFNCGVGMVLAVEPDNVSKVKKILSAKRQRYFLLGEVIRSKKSLSCVEVTSGRHEKTTTLRMN